MAAAVAFDAIRACNDDAAQFVVAMMKMTIHVWGIHKYGPYSMAMKMFVSYIWSIDNCSAVSDPIEW